MVLYLHTLTCVTPYKHTEILSMNKSFVYYEVSNSGENKYKKILLFGSGSL